MTTPDLREAAQWLVDIWADNVAIERGSALWEDIQKVRAALASQPEPLDVERLTRALRAYLDEFRYIDIYSSDLLEDGPELAAYLAAHVR